MTGGVPTTGGAEYDPTSLVGLAMSYGSPDLAWLSGGRCLLFGDGDIAGEWDEAVAALDKDRLVVGPSPEGHLTLLSPRLVQEAICDEARQVLRVSAGGCPIRVPGVAAGQYGAFVAGMPRDSWHTSVPKG